MKELDKNTFPEAIKAPHPVLVDFWAPWCGPCRMMAPVLEEISAEIATAEICKLNIDDFPELAAKYSVSAIPTLILFKEGEEVERITGLRPKADIAAVINRFL